MKKMMLIGMVVVMMLGLVGCNSEEKEIVEKIQSEEVEGFTPTQIEKETAEIIEEIVEEKDLKKYYDTKKYTEEPRLINLEFALMEDTNEFCVIINGVTNSFPNDGRIESGVSYDCIIVDSTIVYIFTE